MAAVRRSTVGPEVIQVLILQLVTLSLAEEVEIFRWLDRYGVSPRVASAAARVWVLASTASRGDPFTMTLLEPWKDVDARALRLGFAFDDPRRLTATVEEALAIRFRPGNMASPSPVLKPLVKRLLAPWSSDPTNAINLTVADLLQSRACRFMEEEVARQIGERIGREVPSLPLHPPCAPERRSVSGASIRTSP